MKRGKKDEAKGNDDNDDEGEKEEGNESWKNKTKCRFSSPKDGQKSPTLDNDRTQIIHRRVWTGSRPPPRPGCYSLRPRPGQRGRGGGNKVVRGRKQVQNMIILLKRKRERYTSAFQPNDPFCLPAYA